MVFPSVMTWLEFKVLPGASAEQNWALVAAFGFGKFVQFCFPFLYVWFFERRRIVVDRPNARGMAVGVTFGLVVAAGTLALYFAWLRDLPVFEGIPGRVQRWLSQFGLANPVGYAAMAFFMAILHSLLEEYYWRWFVFGWLKQYLPLARANLLSSFAFMAHHVIILSVYLEGYFWEAAVPFSLCVAGGGMVWAWLFQRCQSLYAPWISHLIVDLALMSLGFDMLSRFW